MRQEHVTLWAIIVREMFPGRSTRQLHLIIRRIPRSMRIVYIIHWDGMIPFHLSLKAMEDIEEAHVRTSAGHGT